MWYVNTTKDSLCQLYVFYCLFAKFILLFLVFGGGILGDADFAYKTTDIAYYADTADKKNLCFKLPSYICDLLHLIVYLSFFYSQINLKLFLIFNF